MSFRYFIYRAVYTSTRTRLRIPR